MTRYVAFLRGVSPMNAKMPELKRCFEAAGFTNVVTVLSSGNVVFDARKSKEETLEMKIENAMIKNLDRSFLTIVRSVDDLLETIDDDHFQKLKPDPSAKSVITFFKKNHELTLKLPLKKEGGVLLKLQSREAYSIYFPSSKKGSSFLASLERLFGKEVTTRTLDTVRKVTGK